MNYVPMYYMETVIIRTEIKLTTTTVNATDGESTSLHSKPLLTAHGYGKRKWFLMTIFKY